LESPVIAQLNLGGEQLLDRVRRRNRAAIDAVDNRIERSQRAKHAEVGARLSEPSPA
jgi:hypothetical protein